MTYDEAKDIALNHVSPRIGEVRRYRVGYTENWSVMRVVGFNNEVSLDGSRWIDVHELGESPGIKHYMHHLDQWRKMVAMGLYKEHDLTPG